MRPMRQGVAIAFALALVVGGAVVASAADSTAVAPSTPVAQGLSWSFEGTGSMHSVDHPYFGTGDRRDNWSEGFARLRANYGHPEGLWLSVGGTVAGTASTDYYGTNHVGDGRVDQLELGLANVGGSGVSFTAGRQDIVLGDGFLVGDGYVDRIAALWNIPFNFYDGVLVDWKSAKVHALAFGVNISRSLGSNGEYPSGAIYGGELGASVTEGSDVSLAVVQMDDSHATDLNARAYSLRATLPIETVTLSGEAVLEGGTLADADLAGKGGHVKFEVPVKAKWSPVVTGEYFYFSGDDPGTTDNEGYFPFQFRWSDWSKYYVGDLLASTVGTSTDMQILRGQVSVTPREGTGVRLLAHRLDRARKVLSEGSPDKQKAFGYEYDLVVDQAFGPHWSGWVMGGFATPLDAAKAEWGGGATSGQVFASISWKFGSPGSDDE
jgi:hypothetical protein